MTGYIYAVFAVVLWGIQATAVDFKKYKTCKDCIDAGFGWCPIRRICGGFANTECGEGERYWSADYGKQLLEEETKKGGKKKKKKVKLTKDSDLADVIPLTADNFTAAVTHSDAFWLVEFYAPWCGHCKRLAPEWAKAAKVLRGIVHMGAVDADSYLDLASEYDVAGYPTIKAFFTDKKRPEDYEGGRTADGIIDWTLKRVKEVMTSRSGTVFDAEEEKDEEVPVVPKDEKPHEATLAEKEEQQEKEESAEKPTEKKEKKKKKKKKAKKSKKAKKEQIEPGTGPNVIQLTGDDMEKVKASKGIWLVEFFTGCGRCKDFAADFSEVATSLFGKVNVGAIDANINKELADELGAKECPTLVLYKGGATTVYTGELTAPAVMQFVQKALEDLPRVKVEEFTNQAAFKKCTSNDICVVAILPHLMDSGKAGRDSILAKLQKAADAVQGIASMGWVEANSQVQLETRFDVTADLPTALVIDVNNRRASLLTESLTPDSLANLVKSVKKGETAGTSYKRLPPLVPTEPWDGGEYAFPEPDDEL